MYMCSWLLLVAVIETCWWKLLCHICHCWEKLPRVAAHQNALVAGHAYLSHPQQRRYRFGLSPKPIFYLKWVEKTEVDESTSHPQSYAGSTCLLFEGWTSPRKNCFHLEPIWPPSVHWQVAAIPRAGGLAPISWLVTSAFTKTLGLVEGLHGPCFEGKMGKHKICERTEGGFMVVSFLMNPWDMQSTEACLRGCAEIWMYLSQYVSGGFQGSAFQIENHFQALFLLRAWTRSNVDDPVMTCSAESSNWRCTFRRVCKAVDLFLQLDWFTMLARFPGCLA